LKRAKEIVLVVKGVVVQGFGVNFIGENALRRDVEVESETKLERKAEYCKDRGASRGLKSTREADTDSGRLKEAAFWLE